MLTREQILKLCATNPEAIADYIEMLQQCLEKLTLRVKALEDQVAKNSHNSHKPPSSDFGRKQKRPKDKRNRKKAGGQKGHPGSTLKMTKTPDKQITIPVSSCETCGNSLDSVQVKTHERRQVFDIPSTKINITEYQGEIKECPCCQCDTYASFPDTVQNRVQYGNRIKGLFAYMHSYQLIPYERLRQFFQDVFSHSISPGTLVNINNQCSDSLEDFEYKLKSMIENSETVHFDETGFRIQGQRRWLHSASTDKLTAYWPHSRRGQIAMDDMGILPRFQGTAVHDHWESYFNYDCNHSLCNAHHLRELTFVHEQHNQIWAKKMIRCLLDIKKVVEQNQRRNRKKLSKNQINTFEKRYKRILSAGFRDQPPEKIQTKPKRGRKKQSKAKNLLDRLKNFSRETLAFMYNFHVPFDNNLAERDIRMMKVQQKISGCFRSQDGAKAFCRIRSYISTVKKNNQNVMVQLDNLFQGYPFVPSSIPSN